MNKKIMNKETFLKIFYVCMSILLITLTLGGVIGSIISVSDYVHAEELTENSILNFNQFLNPELVRDSYYGLPFETDTKTGLTIIRGSSTQNWVNTHNSIYNLNDMVPYNKKHIYYLNMNYIYNSGLNTSFSLYTNNNGTALSYTVLDGSVASGYVLFRVGEQNYDYFNVFYDNQPRGTYNFSIQPILVDLTQMFGSGNEPQTLTDVRKYLPLDYYTYTESKLLNLTYLDGYNDGAFAMQDGFTISEIASDFINNAYPISTTTFNKIENGVSFDGTIGINTQYTLLANDYIILDLVAVSVEDFQFDITQIDSLGNEIVLQHIKTTEMPTQWTTGGGWSYGGGTYSIKLLNDTNTISFKGECILNVVSIKYKTFNYSQAIVESYKNGRDSVDTNAYYQRGFEDGKNWQINHDSTSAWGSSWEFISSSFSGIGEIMSLEIMPNVPLWTFVAIPLLFGIITFIYKITGN